MKRPMPADESTLTWTQHSAVVLATENARNHLEEITPTRQDGGSHPREENGQFPEHDPHLLDLCANPEDNQGSPPSIDHPLFDAVGTDNKRRAKGLPVCKVLHWNDLGFPAPRLPL